MVSWGMKENVAGNVTGGGVGVLDEQGLEEVAM